MKVRGIQFSPVLGDVGKNIDFHGKEIQRAIDDKVDLIIFPELSLTGYQLKDLVYEVSLTPGDKVLKKFAAMSKGIDIVLGAPYEEIPGIFYNAAFYFSKGRLIHVHKKVQPPNFGMLEEMMIFKAGSEFKAFKIGELTVGILICREILFPAHAYLYYLQHTDLLIGISNSPFRGINREHFASNQFWENIGYTYSVFYHQNYFFVNRTGFEEGTGFIGGSFYARPGKGIDKMAKYFDDDSLDVEINLEDVRRSRLSANYLRDDKPEIVLNELKRILHG